MKKDNNINNPGQEPSAKIFSFHYEDELVRVVTLDNGELGFLAVDVAKILEHSDVSMMVRNLDDDEYLNQTLFVSGQNRNVIILLESGLYTVLIRSNKPQARPFRRWVTHEVLPAIRRTGTYSIPLTQTQFLYGSKSLSHVAEDDDALEKMFRKRKKGLIGIGFDKSVAVRKSLESILEGTGVDLSVRWKFSRAELGETGTSEKGHKNVSPEPEKSDTKVLSQAPKTYREYHLNRRGKNRKGEPIFNLVRKVNGKRFQKYPGVWNQEKADRIIDEMNNLIETIQDK